MKRITYIVIMLLCTALAVSAQDFAPGQQAQGLLESKNVTVDHATGIFHYKVPLYTLKSGSFELPITLDYTGKGVKYEDQPGLVGYNWTLNTGGVVTRTVRGGIPDENDLTGYLWREDDSIPLHQDATKVNLHQRDGECDIFTAVFGGKSVNFIIRKDGANQLYAEPLERTNVKIECESTLGTNINGWIVTDTEGNRYTYRQKEWTEDAIQRGYIGMNGVHNRKYVSSWYLTSIEPANCNTINFHYRNDNNASLNSENFHAIQYTDSYLTKYEYGYPMQVHTFDFEKYRSEFEAEMQQASQLLANDTYLLQANNQMYQFANQGAWIKNPIYDITRLKVEQNLRFAGLVSDFTSISGISGELLSTLEQLAAACREDNFDASQCISRAHSLIEKSLREVEFITERTVNNMTTYKVYSPILTEIKAQDKVLFHYTTDSRNRQLDGLEMRTRSDSLTTGYRLSHQKKYLTSVDTYGNDSLNFSSIGFDYYYTAGVNVTLSSDIYGYFRRDYSGDSIPFDSTLDGEFVKTGSLNKVTFPDGGTLQVDYELNRYLLGNPFPSEYGGIRIKLLTTDNTEENKTDTIKYHYADGFLPYYYGPIHSRTVNYGSFTDIETDSRMRYKSNAILCPGNNGMYYAEVTEEVVGKGSRKYLFNMAENILSNMAYPYWLCKLPIAVISADKDGKLRQAVQNIYLSGYSTEDPYFPCIFNNAFVHNSAASYTESLPQVSADERYTNEEQMDSIYRNQNGLVLNGTVYFSPYNDVYLPNIHPRITNADHSLKYELLYGGATLLKEQVEYRFEGDETIDDWYPDMQEKPYSRTVYHYDNLLESTNPTRIVRYDAAGDSTVTYIRRVEDMQATSGSGIAAMKELNAVDAVVKQTVVKNGRLLTESVSEYTAENTVGKRFYGVSKQSVYAPETAIDVTSVNNMPYSHNESLYKPETTCRYDSIGGTFYLPVQIEKQTGRTALHYENSTGDLQLQAQGVGADEITAVDCKRHVLITGHQSIMQEYAQLPDYARRFMDGVKQLNVAAIPNEGYHTFVQSDAYELSSTLLEDLSYIHQWIGNETAVREMELLLDSIAAQYYMPLADFMDWHIFIKRECYDMAGAQSPWDMSLEEMENLATLVLRGVEDYFHSYLALTDKTMQPVPVEVALNGKSRWKLYALAPAGSHTLTYKADGTSHSLTVQMTADTPLVVKDIHLNGGTGTLELTGVGNTDFVVLVPAGTTFEATHYDNLGRVVARFDQALNLEKYQYDAAGRQTKVTDQGGKTVTENSYNTLNE